MKSLSSRDAVAIDPVRSSVFDTWPAAKIARIAGAGGRSEYNSLVRTLTVASEGTGRTQDACA